ncbi:hypothetical protein [Oceanobacter sp. 3_MG-2023]|jgi:hypothetical protein|uniref:hypothetical protein n=1 Tax=Oceanobacter sp. 3_MG-2023 TaxID=3062622 RepID=UPI0027339801|nr:hypothetical protein [Oceanobacter sp. 3_MG-2023]MDP2504535.1 hypothetical protein [Oceanobacter sp. 3_MG-2023]
MDISQLLPLAAQLVILIALFLVVAPLKKRLDRIETNLAAQTAEQSEHHQFSAETLDSVVNEIKDHFEISLNNLLRDTGDINHSLRVNGEQSQRALELQELVFSEISGGHAHIKDLLSANLRNQKKLAEEMARTSINAFRNASAQTHSDVQQAFAAQDKALLKLSDSSQRMLSSTSAHFNEMSKEVATLKKAVAAMLNIQRKADQMLEPLSAQQQQQLTLLNLVREQQLRQREIIDAEMTILTDLNHSLQLQRQQLDDLGENGSVAAAVLNNLQRNQLEATTFERRYTALSQELAELSVMMQPWLESLSEPYAATTLHQVQPSVVVE